MRTVMIIAVVLAVMGTVMARMAERLATTPAQASTTSVATMPNNGMRSVNVVRDGRGHFQTEGRVDGRRIGFMIDTGATIVALRESDAAMVGVRPAASDFNAVISTANGTVKGARALLDRVEIGDLSVVNVEAVILPDQALGENLLGLSFLNRLRQFEVADGRMVLEK